jgi:hypothetical protein
VNPVVGRGALRNAITQREHFVLQYVMRLAAMDAGQPRPAAPPVAGYDAEPTRLGEDEPALSARLDALAADEARVKQRRSAREAVPRWWRSGALAAAAAVFLGALLRARAYGALVFGLAAVVAYHLLLPVFGLAHSLTAVNKDEWLRPFFMKDMALGVGVCAAAAAALCVRQRRRGADFGTLCALVWLCAAVFCAGMALEIALVYARTDVVPRWYLPPQPLGMTFYLDALAVMAVGLLSPALALIAGLVRLLPAAGSSARPATA